MRLETFRGPDLQSVAGRAHAALGDDAMIVRTRVLRATGGQAVVEVVAASGADVERFRRRLAPAPLDVPTPKPKGARPFVLALVGPTGAGKTTTAAKLAVHPQAFGRYRVGLLTLDTYRVGALEQLQTYAEIADLPMEVVYDASEIEGALKRLGKCEVVLVDTPGRSPKLQDRNAEWRDMLLALRPDEVHLVVPASVRLDIGESVREAFASHGVTHLLLTKLDEVPGETGVADLAARVDLPTRWVTDGQEIPADLRGAGPRILQSLGVGAEPAVVPA